MIMSFAINMYDCELTSYSRKTFCRQNQTNISGGGGRIKERTTQYRVLACELRYRNRQNDNVALLDKSIK